MSILRKSVGIFGLVMMVLGLLKGSEFTALLGVVIFFIWLESTFELKKKQP